MPQAAGVARRGGHAASSTIAVVGANAVQVRREPKKPITRITLSALMGAALATSAEAAIIYDEALDGDTGQGFIDRETLTLVDGLNVVKGRFSDVRLAGQIDPSQSDTDEFGFAAPAGRQLRNLSFEVEATVLRDLTSLDLVLNVREDELQSPARFGRTDRLTLVEFGGATTFGPLSTTGLEPIPGVSDALLEPLSPGVGYVFAPTGAVSGTGDAFGYVVNYTISFENFDPAAGPDDGGDTGVAPVPAALPLLGLGLGALGVAGRRRRRRG